MEINGNRYKGCICWKCYPSMSHACVDICKKEQRDACNKQFIDDRYGKEKERIESRTAEETNGESNNFISEWENIQ